MQTSCALLCISLCVLTAHLSRIHAMTLKNPEKKGWTLNSAGYLLGPFSLTGGTISFLTNARGYFFLGVWACVLEGFAVTFFGIVALWSLAILAFERYFVICRPLKNVRLGGKHAAMGLVFAWTFSFIWTIPPVLGWNSYTVSKIGTTCEPNWYSTDFYDHTYIITFFITCFILPLGVIIISYGKLMQKLRKFRKCLIQMFKGNVTNLDSTNLNQTSDKGAITATAESHLEEMSTIAARVPMSMYNMEKSEDEEEESEQSGNEGPKQLSLSDSRVCPL
ncbi:hypothetical protein cypCar_00034357 [Cyprinus carpio]|nr:hypothetical protein cypCar_00034357 [Cyprinus carpio]